MVWLLFKVIRDRPGILRDVSSILASRGINIRNYFGNIYAGVLEVESEFISESDFMGIHDIKILAQLPHTFDPIVLDKSVLIHAVMTGIRQYGLDLRTALFRIGTEYGKEFVRRLGGGPRELINIAMHLMSAFNIFNFKEVRGYEDIRGRGVIEVIIENPFDADVELSFTKGFIHGIFKEALSPQLFYLEDPKRIGGNTWSIILRPL